MKPEDGKVRAGTAAQGCPAEVARLLCGAADVSRARVPAPHKQRQRGRQAAHALLLCLAVFLFAGAGDPSSRFNEIGHRLMCVCGACGDLLLECNHVGCSISDGMRNELASAVQRGDSDSLVSQAFVQKYGPTVLAAPTTTGFNRTAWIVPFAALFLGLGIVVMVVRNWRSSPADAPSGQVGSPRINRAEFEHFRDQADKETEL